MSEIEKPTSKKMNTEEFFETVVAKVAKASDEINQKFDALTEYLLNEFKRYAVDEDKPMPQWLEEKYAQKQAQLAALETGSKVEPLNDEEYGILEEMAQKRDTTVEEMLCQTMRKRTAGENGKTRVTVDLTDAMIQHIQKRLKESKLYNSLDEFVSESIRIRLQEHPI